MKETPVRLEVAAGIAQVIFDRPEALNAIDVDSARRLLSVCEELRERTDVRVIVLSGAGRAFMAGGDLAAFHASADPVRLASEIIEPLHRALAMLAALPQPVLGSVQGAVSGAGMSIALGCDLTIAAADSRFCLAYSAIAGSLDAGGSWYLARRVGLQRAMRLALLNEVLSGEQALQLGLVALVVEPGELAEETRKLAKRLAIGPGFAYGQIKGLLRGSLNRNLEQQLDAELDAFRACAGHSDFREGIAAFFAKRRALFSRD